MADCFAGATGSGKHVVAFCFGKWAAKLTSTWATAEARGRDCLTVGDSAAAEKILNDFMGPLATALFTPARNQCVKLKYAAVAKAPQNSGARLVLSSKASLSMIDA
jgi:hypothetical protein